MKCHCKRFILVSIIAISVDHPTRNFVDFTLNKRFTFTVFDNFYGRSKVSPDVIHKRPQSTEVLRQQKSI